MRRGGSSPRLVHSPRQKRLQTAIGGVARARAVASWSYDPRAPERARQAERTEPPAIGMDRAGAQGADCVLDMLVCDAMELARPLG